MSDRNYPVYTIEQLKKFNLTKLNKISDEVWGYWKRIKVVRDLAELEDTE